MAFSKRSARLTSASFPLHLPTIDAEATAIVGSFGEDDLTSEGKFWGVLVTLALLVCFRAFLVIFLGAMLGLRNSRSGRNTGHHVYRHCNR
jgi:hypothetical protein